ncbi:hypothetical protein [Mycobacterium avium]|uniref:hypothetical protein n=1 Tax=Mycobacterium avium TaxID=1764 RepID=UPI001CC785B4|nr:hypothetical protein [Mycobacterium avium]
MLVSPTAARNRPSRLRFTCSCTRSQQDRRRSWEQWHNDNNAFWETAAVQQITADEQAAEADLQAWLATQHDVIVGSHGGLAPEQWDGEVDGYSFYFRERHGEWRMELDLRPGGRVARTLAGTNSDGTPRYGRKEIEQGDIIAQGTIDDDGYGATPVERAQFIIDSIRIHLARKACALHHEDLSSIEALLATQVSWCPACGTRMLTG